MFSLYVANKSISFVHQLKNPKAAELLSRSSTTCKSGPSVSEWGRKERHRASTQSQTFISSEYLQPKQVQFRSLKSPAQLQETPFMMYLSPACVLPFIQVQYTYLSDLPETPLKPRV